MLVKNAQNLMQAVIKTIQAAEAAYVKVIFINIHTKHIQTLVNYNLTKTPFNKPNIVLVN